jgi:protein TonB
MVVQQALAPAFVQAISAADPDHRRRLSRTTAIAVALSVAAHVTVGVYVYEAKYAALPTTIPTDGPTTTLTPTIVIKQPPPKPTTHPPPHRLAVRPSTGPVTPQTHTADFTPTVTPPLDVRDPPTLAENFVPQPPRPTAPSVITEPDWLTRPGPNEFSRFYPQPALERDASGAATLSCTVGVTGAVRDCQVTAETPKGMGFGDAARKLAPYFRLRPQTRDGTPVDGGIIHIPIRFNLA